MNSLSDKEKIREITKIFSDYFEDHALKSGNTFKSDSWFLTKNTEFKDDCQS